MNEIFDKNAIRKCGIGIVDAVIALLRFSVNQAPVYPEDALSIQC
jgi:hypothetical protein